VACYFPARFPGGERTVSDEPLKDALPPGAG
jgi:hypothetical protein